MGTRRLVESALQDCLALARWRPLARRARMKRLYFQLRGNGLARREARGIVGDAQRAIPGLRKEPKGLATALDVIVP